MGYKNVLVSQSGLVFESVAVVSESAVIVSESWPGFPDSAVPVTDSVVLVTDFSGDCVWPQNCSRILQA